MLIFAGLGLYDLDDISIKGFNAIKEADLVFLEAYTSILSGTTPEEMRKRYGKEIIILKRQDVEQEPEPILDAAEKGNVVFLTGGDRGFCQQTFISGQKRAAKTRSMVLPLAPYGLISGLQEYRFGKSCSSASFS